MSETKELILRLEAKKKEFQAELVSIQNDMTESAKVNKEALESKIKEMSADLMNAKEGFSEKVAKKINEWLK